MLTVILVESVLAGCATLPPAKVIPNLQSVVGTWDGTVHYSGAGSSAITMTIAEEGSFYGNTPDVNFDGTITIVVRQDVYEVRMPARDSYRQYPIERPGQALTQREAC